MAKIPLNTDTTENTQLDPETDAAMIGIAGPVKVGDNIFVRTVTYHAIGQVAAIYPGCFGGNHTWVKLNKGVFVKDSGEFTTVLFGKAPVHNFEPMPDGYLVNLSCATDIIPWNPALPTVAGKKNFKPKP